MDYYNERDSVSNSMIGNLIEDPVLFSRWMNGEDVYKTTADMLIGSIAHWEYMKHKDSTFAEEEPTYVIIDDFNARTRVGKAYRDKILKQYPLGGYLTKEQAALAQAVATELISNKTFNKYIDDLAMDYTMKFEEVSYRDINVLSRDGEENSMTLRGKTDIAFYDEDDNVVKIVDIKTTGSLSQFRRSVYKYGYNRQAAFYCFLKGIDIMDSVYDLAVIGKDDFKMKIFDTGRSQFAEEAKKAFYEGLEHFVNWRNGDVTNLMFDVL